MKICYFCHIEKPLEAFHKNKAKADGYTDCCKICRKIQSKSDYQNRKEYIKKRVMIYHNNHKEQIKLTRNVYQKRRLKEDPCFRVTRNLRNRLYYALQNKMWKKDTTFDSYIGLDNYEDLKIYLESKFTGGMSWENYGDWEIDHIIPLSSAQDKEELYKLSHYTNLQPMWKAENRSKRDSIK